MFSVVPAGTSAAPAKDGDGRSLPPLQQKGREFVGHVEHHIMPACKLLLPPAALSCLGIKLAERTVMATRQDVSDGCHAVAGAADPRRRFKTGQRMHRTLTVHPSGVCRIDREYRRRDWGNLPAIAVGPVPGCSCRYRAD